MSKATKGLDIDRETLRTDGNTHTVKLGSSTEIEGYRLSPYLSTLSEDLFYHTGHLSSALDYRIYRRALEAHVDPNQWAAINGRLTGLTWRGLTQFLDAHEGKVGPLSARFVREQLAPKPTPATNMTTLRVTEPRDLLETPGITNGFAWDQIVDMPADPAPTAEDQNHTLLLEIKQMVSKVYAALGDPFLPEPEYAADTADEIAAMALVLGPELIVESTRFERGVRVNVSYRGMQCAGVFPHGSSVEAFIWGAVATACDIYPDGAMI